MNQPPKASKQSVWSLVLGILSITCIWLLGAIPAIILGAIGMKKAKENPGVIGGHGVGLAGLICGCVGLVAGIMPVAILSSIALPAVQGTQGRAYLAKDINNIRNLSLGLRSYASDNEGAFPSSIDELFPTYIDDPVFQDMITRPFEEKRWAYFYRPGLSDASDVTEPVLLSVHPRRNNYAVGYMDGTVKQIKSEEFDRIRPLFPE